MPVFRIEKTKDFTVMSNHHLRNREISLKAKGLLSQMLSLPPDWDYTLAGLAAIKLEGSDAIREAVKELEAAGYITREQCRTDKGRFSSNEYVIRELPLLERPTTDNPQTEMPMSDHPSTGPPVLGNPREISKESKRTEGKNTDYMNNLSNHIRSLPREEADRMRLDRELYRNLIKSNIEYNLLSQNWRDREEVDEIVEIMLDAICSSKPMIVVRGQEMPTEVVKSRLLKLKSEHVQYVLDSLRTSTVKARNIKQYLLAALYNAPSTINTYYTNLVNHDLYGGG